MAKKTYCLQGGLSQKEAQLDLCNIIFILFFDELISFVQ